MNSNPVNVGIAGFILHFSGMSLNASHETGTFVMRFVRGPEYLSVHSQNNVLMCDDAMLGVIEAVSKWQARTLQALEWFDKGCSFCLAVKNRENEDMV